MPTITGNHVIYAFEPDMEAVLSVDDGSIVTFESNDCYFGQIQTEEDDPVRVDRDFLNPATGPVYIRGADPGDTLRVDILGIDIADRGIMVVLPGEGLLKKEAKNKTVRVIPIVDGAAEYLGLRIPVHPMIGVIGVAPALEDGPCPTHTPYRHGGNMDTRDIVRGTRLYLPVMQKGALFALGDCHALMADGEVCQTGLEVSARVTVRLSVIKGNSGPWPLLETADRKSVV